MLKKYTSWVGLVAALLTGGCFPRMSMAVPESELDQMAEQEALALTRGALVHAGIDADNYEPVPYWNNSSALFASNALEPGSGYVLWKNTNHPSGHVFDYSVTIRRGRGKATISVIEPK